MAEIDKYLAGKYPLVKEIHDNLLAKIQQLIKRFRIESREASINLVAWGAFLSFRFLKDRLRVTIVLDRPIEHKHLHKSGQVSRKRFHNEVDLFKVTDIDTELLDLVKEAYLLHSFSQKEELT